MRHGECVWCHVSRDGGNVHVNFCSSERSYFLLSVVFILLNLLFIGFFKILNYCSRVRPDRFCIICRFCLSIS